jgi:hypothetical protein
MMSQDNKKKQTISPVTWIILVLAMAGFIYIYFTPQPDAGGVQPTPAPVNSVEPTDQPVATVSEGSQEIDPNAAGTTTSEVKAENVAAGNTRNPFLPPSIVRNYLSKPKHSSSFPIVTTPSVPVTGGSSEKITEKPVEKPVEIKPVWKGFLGTRHDRLAIVRYKGKAYFLRVGDRIQGTDYVLTRMESEYIVLDSPKEQVRLVKEKTGGKK